MNKNITLSLLIEYINNLYALENQSIQNNLLDKNLQKFFNIKLNMIKKNNNVNIFFKKYINILNIHILDINFVLNNLQQLSAENWIILFNYCNNDNMSKTIKELMVNNTSTKKFYKILNLLKEIQKQGD